LCAGLLSEPGGGGGAAPDSARGVAVALENALSALDAPAASPARTGQAAPAPLGAAERNAAAAATVAMPAPEPLAPRPPPSAEPASAKTQPVPVVAPPARTGSSPVAPAQRRGSRVLLWVAAAVLVVGAALLAYQLGRSAGTPDEGSPSAAPNGGTNSPPPAALERISIASVIDFDPVADQGSGTENPNLAPLAIDGDPQTAWTTLVYRDDPQLGGLKPGVGLVVDLGAPETVAEVTARLLGTGTSVQLRAAPRSAQTVPTSAAGFQVVARAPSAGDTVALRPTRPVTSRFLLVYLTSLPQVEPARYQGSVAEITVRG
jgi:hypothetical protein